MDKLFSITINNLTEFFIKASYLYQYFIPIQPAIIQSYLSQISYNINSYKSMAAQKELIAALVALVIASGALFSLAPEVPEVKENLKCVARSTMIQRGQVWVDKHVPYNQGGSYDGYRTDCSGFVSMCWELAKPGLTTFTMHTVAHNINKDQLAAGDAMNCDSRHIVLFAGWADSGKSQYVAMQEANSSTGTIKRNIPYPYFGGDSCFHPIRFNEVC